MALSVAQGFSIFLDRLIPLQSQRTATARHRASVERSLLNALSVNLFRETGSFTHGTGVRNHADVDLLVSLKGARPGSSDTALSWVRSALAASFPTTVVRTSRPAVVIEFANGDETWEVIPGFITSRGPSDVSVYDIPGPSTGWIDSAPAAHLKYVTEVNAEPKISGGAKKLARLAKAWKYYNNVPISSFYLEMRAAKYLSGDSLFDPIMDICLYLEYLKNIGLASMQDPKGASGKVYACSTTTKAEDALSKLSTAATRARKALNATNSGDADTAFRNLDLLFGGKFPAR
ncbi:nucleotidyltransferase [Streptomyces mirabilis]|uniref:SMODS domain-containing nucleotidyltransferase n=1 Tax=Streptomyces mirabilis TaxID=68239 RepID=UPI00365A5C68